jgi:hypothetical protein
MYLLEDLVFDLDDSVGFVPYILQPRFCQTYYPSSQCQNIEVLTATTLRGQAEK